MKCPSFNRTLVRLFHCSKAMKQEDMAADSACVARYRRDEKPLSYTLKLQSFSLLNKAVTNSTTGRYESHIFNVGGYKWKLALYPTGDEKRNGCGHISLYLVLTDADVLSTALEVKAVFTFLVYDKLKDKYLSVQDGKIRRFSAFNTEWGIDKLLPLATLNNYSNGFLVDDCCVFGVDIFVMKHENDGKGEIFSLIKQPINYKYTWKVNNFSQLEKSYYESDLFHVEGCRWKLQLYPKGDCKAKPDNLSLFFILDNLKELPQDIRVYVEIEVAILNQLGSHEHKVSSSIWYESGRVNSRGYSDFMSLTKLNDPTKGFMCKDTMILEVKINVISTFNKIE